MQIENLVLGWEEKNNTINEGPKYYPPTSCASVDIK